MFSRLLTYDLFQKRAFYDRDRYDDILQDPKSTLGKKLSGLIVLCIIISVGLVVLETVPEIYTEYGKIFFISELVISVVFLLEYIYRWFRSHDKIEFVGGFFNVVDFLSFAPFFIALMFPALASLNILKVLRLLRILRLFEVSAKSPIAIGFIHTIQEYHKEYKAIFTLFVSLLIIISSFVYLLEYPANASFSSIPESLWWGLVTMTTVGYGDMVPYTVSGKILGAVLILLGPVLLAVISSITILVFMDVAESQKITSTKICQTCKTRNTEHANFCLNCGEQHFTDSGVVEKSLHTGIKNASLFKRFFSKK
ncbi:ion transporter [Candidatus Gracilibacteria bacterium]|nr:ion transporter [Candidatus Gracilibacteria bacterium]